MHNLKINIFPRLPFHPPITENQVRIRNWECRKRERERASVEIESPVTGCKCSDGSFPLFAAHFCRRAPPSRFYRGPETVHRRCRRYAGRIELNGAKGGGSWLYVLGKRFSPMTRSSSNASPSKPSLSPFPLPFR